MSVIFLPEKKLTANHDRLPDEISLIINAKMLAAASLPGNPALCRKIALELPDFIPLSVELDSDIVRAGIAGDISEDGREKLKKALLDLNPWRKGPFNLFGIHIDTEWRSDLKWNRIKKSITPFNGRRILDIGCSNGYYMFRMAASNPEFVIGIDPFPNFYWQFMSLQKYIRSELLHYIPAGFEVLSDCGRIFDTVFCMGILYHRKSPVETLEKIRTFLAPAGELVIETLIIPGEADIALCPESRYSKMKNVYFIPTIKCLETWLFKAGFKDIRLLDVSKTTFEEQRKTDWIQSESLDSFLDPSDSDKTVEGYPAPVRAALSAVSR